MRSYILKSHQGNVNMHDHRLKKSTNVWTASSKICDTKKRKYQGHKIRQRRTGTANRAMSKTNQYKYKAIENQMAVE